MDDAAWSGFVERNFEKEPTVLRGWLRERPLATEREIFQLLASLPDHSWPEAERTFRFYDGPEVVQNPFARLPRESDADLKGYIQRAAREFSANGEFGLVVNKVSELSMPLWRRTCEFLQPLFARVGRPAGATSMQIFLSHCPHTPFGIHKDNASIFHTVVRGPKRMLVWPYETLAHLISDGSDMRQEGHDLEGLPVDEVRDRAIVLEGQTGDILYWPSTYWHVGEAVPGQEYSLSFNAALAVTQPKHVLDCLAEQLMRRALIAPAPIKTAIDEHGEMTVPKEIADIATRLRALIEEGDLAQILSEGWMEHVSSAGFVERPRSSPSIEIDEHVAVRTERFAPVLWRRARERSIAVCANGRTIDFERDGGITTLLGLINGEQARPVRELIAAVGRCEEAWDPDTVLAFLSALNEVHALVVSRA